MSMKWISVKKALPASNDNVQFITVVISQGKENNLVRVANYDPEEEYFRGGWNEKLFDVRAWMPLPPPYDPALEDAGWITTGKPSNNGNRRLGCLVTCLGIGYFKELRFDSPKVIKADYKFEECKFKTNDTELIGVTAWMPLPEAYIENNAE